MSKWVLDEEPEMVPVPIDSKTYQEHLAQIAKILYKQFCQLDPRFQPIAIPLSRHSVPQGNREVRR
jgi:hypothetical protein